MKLIIPLTIALTINIALGQIGPTLPKEMLGTSMRTASVYNRDIEAATKLAFPNYKEDILGKYFEKIANTYPNGFDTLKINLAAILNNFQITASGEGEAQEPDFSYQIQKKTGAIYLYRNRDNIKPYSVDQGMIELKRADSIHRNLLNQFGIDKSQLYSFNSNLILFDGIQRFSNGRYSRPTTPMVDDIFTYGKRMLDGIIVEGSNIKVIAKDSKTFEGLIINWPRFQIHPELKRFELKAKNDLLTEALDHIKKTANPKHEINVKMAVVFRPVMVSGEKLFIPALKIGFYTRPFDIKFPDEKGENGELFYIDLMKQKVEYSDTHLSEKNEGEE